MGNLILGVFILFWVAIIKWVFLYRFSSIGFFSFFWITSMLFCGAFRAFYLVRIDVRLWVMSDVVY